MRTLATALLTVAMACPCLAQGQAAATQLHDKNIPIVDWAFDGLSTVAPYNEANAYTAVPDAQIQPPGVLIDSNNFSSTGDFTTFIGGSATFTVLGNVGTVGMTTSSDYVYGFDSKTAYTFNGPAIFIQVNVASAGAAGSGFTAAAILGKDTNNWIRAGFAPGINTSLCVDNAGTANCATGSAPSPTAPYQIGLSIVGNSAGTWINSGSGWVEYATAAIGTWYNAQAPGAFTGWMSGFFVALGLAPAQSWQFSNLKGGGIGGVAIRDISAVTYPDGRPYVQGSLLYLTANLSGLDSVFTYDLMTGTLAQVSDLLDERGGVLLTDTASDLIYDPVNQVYYYLCGGWGSQSPPNVSTFYATFSKASLDPLTPGIHIVTGATVLDLPGQASFYSWDAHMACSAWNYSTSACAKWVAAYAVSAGSNVFYPGAAYTTNLAGNSWTQIGTPDSANGTGWEGARIIRDAVTDGSKGVTYDACFGGSSLTAVRALRCYDLDTFAYLGSPKAQLPVQANAGYGPHPMMFESGKSVYFLTFNNNIWSSCSSCLGNFMVATGHAFTPANNINFGTSTSTTCPTGTTAWASCTFTVPLVYPEPDANYSVKCSGIGATGFPHVRDVQKSATFPYTTLTVTVSNGDTSGAVASSYSSVTCVAGGS